MYNVVFQQNLKKMFYSTLKCHIFSNLNWKKKQNNFGVKCVYNGSACCYLHDLFTATAWQWWVGSWVITLKADTKKKIQPNSIQIGPVVSGERIFFNINWQWTPCDRKNSFARWTKNNLVTHICWRGIVHVEAAYKIYNCILNSNRQQWFIHWWMNKVISL